METRVTYRTSQETVKRLQELADKYGISQSALLTMLVNDRWLTEHQPSSAAGSSQGGARGLVTEPEPPPNFPEDYMQAGKKSKHRKRH